MKNRIALTWLLAFLFLSQGLSAQKAVDSIHEYAGSAESSMLVTDSESLYRLKKNRAFGYMNYLDSLLRLRNQPQHDSTEVRDSGQFKKNIKHHQNNSYFNKLLNSRPVKTFFWLAAIFFIGFILFNLIIKNGFLRTKTKHTLKSNEAEAFHGLAGYSEYDEWIAKAEQHGNLNLAVRYLFLRSLKVMADRQIIDFSPEKTNRDYIEQIPVIHRYAYTNLIRNYEYIWYGKFLITKEKYQQIKLLFKDFENKITLA